MFAKEHLKLYFICGSQDIPHETSLTEVVTEALKSGITMFQFREKGEGSISGSEKITLDETLLSQCRSYHVPFIVNDDDDLAEMIEADGIHVGQKAENIAKVDKEF